MREYHDQQLEDETYTTIKYCIIHNTIVLITITIKYCIIHNTIVLITISTIHNTTNYSTTIITELHGNDKFEISKSIIMANGE